MFWKTAAAPRDPPISIILAPFRPALGGSPRRARSPPFTTSNHVLSANTSLHSSKIFHGYLAPYATWLAFTKLLLPSRRHHTPCTFAQIHGSSGSPRGHRHDYTPIRASLYPTSIEAFEATHPSSSLAPSSLTRHPYEHYPRHQQLVSTPLLSTMPREVISVHIGQGGVQLGK